MEIWVLGTLEVSHGGRSVEVRGRVPRRLLALLTLSPGTEVACGQLVDGLWGEEPPAAAASTLQSHVARLRRDLPVAGVLRAGRRGYALDVASGDIDAFAFERAIGAGSQALLAGRTDEASA